MRVAAHVLLAYALVVVVGAVWRLVPLGRLAPDVIALSAVYLGLTARHRLAQATLGAVVLGYLGDLLLGGPLGLLSLSAGLICILGQLVHQRLLVRGVVVTVGVSFMTGLISGLLGLGLRAYAGLLPDGVGLDLDVIAGCAVITGLMGPLVFRIFRSLDARFVRTYRERDALQQ
ncbi:MAG: hypothetical protein AAGC55_23825 [Myxococcota bacterium]